MGQRFQARYFPLGLVLLLAAFVGGCQSSAGPEALESAKAAKSADVASAGAMQTFGAGSTRVDLFIDASISNFASDYRDGAALAAKELGAGQLALTVHDLRAPGSDPATQARQAIGDGSRLFIAPPSLAGTFGSNSSGPAVILLDGQAASAAVALASDEIDSAVEVSSYAVGVGRKKIMAVATRALSASEMQRLQSGLKKSGGQLLDVVTDPTSADGAARLAKLGDAQAVLLIGPDAPKVAAPALRARSGLEASVPFLGTFAWPGGVYGEPALEGSLLALVDQKALKRISTRFQTTYGRPLSLEAAYGFDAVAVAAGIIRAKGGEGLNTASLHTSAGFSGATGIFRFGTDGRAERRLAIYRLIGGRLALQDTPVGF